MKIGFDISQTCENKAGCAFCADQLVKALAKIDHNNEYILFPQFYDYKPTTINKATKVDAPNFKEKVVRDFSDNDSTISKLDIIHSNCFRFPYGVSAKKVVTMYDVSFFDHPEFTTEENRII